MGLKNPPKINMDLIHWVNAFDLIALIIGFSIQLEVGIGIFLYIIVSRAYSYPKIRLKKLPLIGLLSVSVFQGYVVFILVTLGLRSISISSLSAIDHFGGIICSMLLFGSYPMTQIYQHEEDEKHKDKTISLVLGVNGTFIFTSVFFAITIGLFFLLLQKQTGIGSVLAPIGAVYCRPLCTFFVGIC